MMQRLLLLVALLIAALALTPARSQALAPAPVAPDVSVTQKLDAALPLDMPIVDANGDAARLGDAFDDRPVLLVLGYYRCPQLCGLLMHGLLESLQATHLPRNAYRVVGLSIDPADTPETAAERLRSDLAYADFLEGTKPSDDALDLRLLLGRPQDVSTLATRVGFRYARDETRSADVEAVATRYDHGAAVIVVTPHGRVSKYLMGVRFDPSELRLALVDASSGRIGSLGDRIALLCAHVDPQLGRHSAAVLTGMQIAGAALVLALSCLTIGLMLRQRRTTPRRPAP